MSDRWWKYFESNLSGKNWLEEAVSQFQFMQPFYGMIQRYIPKGGKILDVGCGLGFNDIYLSSLGYDVTGIDNDQRIVSAATQNATRLGSQVCFKQGDAFDLSGEYGKYDLVYSLGVLEHFDREVTITLLEEQKKCAELVLIEIPTKYAIFSGGITDERIYKVSELEKIVAESGLQVCESFGFGDVMATPYYVWLKRILPYGLYRYIQNKGFSYAIAVVGRG